MALSVLSGRIRPRRTAASCLPGSIDNDSINKLEQQAAISPSFSVASVALPTGTLTVHSSEPCSSRQTTNSYNGGDGETDGNNKHDFYDTGHTYRKSRCNVYNITEVHNFGRGPIVDHCWTTTNLDSRGDGAKGSDEQERENSTVLAVLTRSGGSQQRSRDANSSTPNRPTGPSSDVLSPAVASVAVAASSPTEAGSVVRLYRPDDSKDLNLVRTMSLPRFASSVAMGNGALVISTPSGAVVYCLRYLLDGKPTTPAPPPVELMRNHCVHSLMIVGNYIIAASGDRLGIWSIDTILGSSNVGGRSRAGTVSAVWSTTITGCASRVTSLAMSDDSSTLAASCWDGSAYVYRARSSIAWDRVESIGDTSSPPPWEVPVTKSDAIFPTFVAISSTPSSVRFGSTMVAVSTSSSGVVRCFDIDRGERCRDFGGPSDAVDSFSGAAGMGTDRSIHGLLATQRTLFWIDDKDVIHQQEWPAHMLDMQRILSEIPRGEYRTIVASRKSSPHCSEVSSVSHEAWIVLGCNDQSWRLECAWSLSGEVPAGRLHLSVPFLTDECALELARNSNAISCKCAFICDLYVGIHVPSEAMLYVYSRLGKAWRAIDTANDCDEVDRASVDISFVAPQYVVATSLSSPNNGLPELNARIWDLSLRGECFVASKKIALQGPES